MWRLSVTLSVIYAELAVAKLREQCRKQTESLVDKELAAPGPVSDDFRAVAHRVSMCMVRSYTCAIACPRRGVCLGVWV